MGSTTNTARWSLTSGGTGGAAVPNSYDDVYFNGSGLGSSTVNATATIKNLYIDSGYSGNLIINDDVTYVISLPDALPSLVTVVKNGRQIATSTTPVTGQSLGGAFLFSAMEGGATVTSVKLKQAGSVATSSISNVTLSFKNAVSSACSSTTPAATTLFGVAGAFDASSYATTTGTMPLYSDIPVCLYINYDLTGEYSINLLGRTISLEINNPSTDIGVTGGVFGETYRVNIYGNTMIINNNDVAVPIATSTKPHMTNPTCFDSKIYSLLSIRMRNPTKNPTVYYLQNCIIWKKEGADSPHWMTSQNLQVYSLHFTDLSLPNTPGIIKTNLKISNVDPTAPASFINYAKTFTGQSFIRAYNPQ